MSYQEYDQLSEEELISYYMRVKGYIDQGFRVDGLKEELELIYEALKRKSHKSVKNKDVFLKEIDKYLRTIRL
ncbi:hypothetical protein QA612_20875 [Evansella sp. AB-P1]|uniref:hypothetical protein n=1 Tax=Evansella sp. AB-P1 TaxID=3037653 RepID=UPI00241EE3C2|nr:hypothetical protein [Evansella sp. AB-P1]MDG5789914.1 hypothetical protein [Evansella sp. AB-P1]